MPCMNRSGRDRVRRDAVTCDVVGKRYGHRYDCGLCGGIVGFARRSHHAGKAREVYDPAPLRRQQSGGHPDNREDVPA